MNKNRKKFLLWLAALTITVSIFGFSTSNAEAARAEVLPVYWESVWKSGGSVKYNENYQYKTITYTNGYSYKDTKKGITSFGELLVGTERTAHYRTYSVY